MLTPEWGGAGASNDWCITNLQNLFCVIIGSITAVIKEKVIEIIKFWRVFQFAIFVVGNLKFNHSYNPLLSNAYLIEVAISRRLL